MPIGMRDLSTIQLPVGWDMDRLREFDRQQNVPFSALVRSMDRIMQSFNREINNHPLYSLFSYVTNQPAVEYPQGAVGGVQRFTELGRPEAYRGDTTGHMLPIEQWDRGLEWTWAYLREAEPAKLETDLDMALVDFRNKSRINFLKRALKRTDETGKYYGLGTSGISPGFATAAANTGVDFTPLSHNGTDFDSDHDHYIAYASASPLPAHFEAAQEDLEEHGIMGPYFCFVSPTDEDAITGMTGFHEPAQALVEQSVLNHDFAAVTEDPNLRNIGVKLLGVLDKTEIIFYSVPGWPTEKAWVFRSYGRNSPMNPIWMRVPKGQRQIEHIVMPDPRSGGNATHPLQYMMIFTEYGAGVGRNRINSVMLQWNNGTWSDGEPS